MEIRGMTFRDLSIGDCFLIVDDAHHAPLPYLRTEDVVEEEETDTIINSVSFSDGIFHAFDDDAKVVRLSHAKVVI